MPNLNSSIPLDTAMVFAAGFGTRMRPLTNNIPKPLIKICNKTMLDHVLDNLLENGIKKVVVNTHYLADMIEKHLQNRTAPEVIISRESPDILETGGGIVQALPHLGTAPFFTVNTDSLLIEKGKPAIIRLTENWNPEKMDALLLLIRKEDAVGYDGNGDFDITQEGFLKKRHNGGKFIYSGTMIVKPDLFYNQPLEPFSIFRDYLFKSDKQILPDGTMPKLQSIVHEGKWLHIGTPDMIEVAEKILFK